MALCTLKLTRPLRPDEVVRNTVKLHFVKDRYAAYTELSGSFEYTGDLSDVTGIKLTAGGRNLHYGPLEYYRCEQTAGRVTVSFRSRGWSSALTMNEPVPGMNYNLDLAGLAAANPSMPHVTYESNTSAVNYIYVKEHSTLWEAVSAYAMKAYGTQPYIYGHNQVCVRIPQGSQYSIAPGDAAAFGTVRDRRAMLSKVYMADIDDQYTYSVTNSQASGTELVREHYYELDRQWLASPATGLQQRIDRSNRHSFDKFIRRIGFAGEDLFDVVSATVNGVTVSGRVCGIELTAEKKQIETVLYLGTE
ncbi:MAG: hypothetical protein IKN17_12420 [Ruminococcus sp.]|nr:hypothetical protein [Ruminococcus sp.]